MPRSWGARHTLDAEAAAARRRPSL